MSLLTTLLYWLSTGMLIPVIILLLIAFGWSLLLLGDLYGHYTWRLRHRKPWQALMQQVKQDSVRNIDWSPVTQGRNLLVAHLRDLIEQAWHPLHSEKTLSDFEITCQKEMQPATTLMRVGPMLGLMGTLIPMGPALSGLASGDITSMAANLQVAFSTTVVGIFVGAMGFIVQLVRKRWRQADAATLSYLFELAQEDTPS